MNVSFHISHLEVGNDDPPTLDFADTVLDPHEYNGITWFGDTILTTFAGTDGTIQAANKTMIWSTRIDWTWQQP